MSITNRKKYYLYGFLFGLGNLISFMNPCLTTLLCETSYNLCALMSLPLKRCGWSNSCTPNTIVLIKKTCSRVTSQRATSYFTITHKQHGL